MFYWFSFISHSPLEAQMFQYLRWYLEPRHPFYDYDLMNFAHRLPNTLKWLNRFFFKAMKHCFPSLSKISFEHGVSFSSNPLLSDFGELKINLRKGMHIGFLGVKDRGKEFDYRNYGEWIRSTRTYIENHLCFNPRLTKLVKEDFINKIITVHMNGKADHNELIPDLLNIELLLRQ